MPQDIKVSESVRYGFFIGGPQDDTLVRVLIPEAMASEYIARAPVYPVPRAPERLRGMTQLRGQAIMVVDVCELADTRLPVVHDADLLVLGGGQQAVALIQSQAPQQVTCVADVEVPADFAWYHPALGIAYQSTLGDIWRELDVEELVHQCLYSEAAGASPGQATARYQTVGATHPGESQSVVGK